MRALVLLILFAIAPSAQAMNFIALRTTLARESGETSCALTLASRRKPIRILIALGSPGDSGPLTADRAIAAGDGCVAPRQAMGLAAVTLYWDFMIDHRPLQSLGKHRKTIRLERSRTLRGVLAEVELSRLNVPFVIEGDELAVPAGFDAFLVPDPSLPVRVVLLQPVPHVELTGVLVPDLLDALEISPRAILVAMDDISLDEGRVKLSGPGGDYGHLAIRRLTEALGTNAFYRLRVGIGRPESRASLPDYLAARGGSMELVYRMGEPMQDWLSAVEPEQPDYDTRPIREVFFSEVPPARWEVIAPQRLDVDNSFFEIRQSTISGFVTLSFLLDRMGIHTIGELSNGPLSDFEGLDTAQQRLLNELLLRIRLAALTNGPMPPVDVPSISRPPRAIR